jgi:SPP1 family predicted phage head-tail adaptor
VPSWGTYAVRWAAVEPLTGREYFTAQQMQATVTTRIRLRYWANHGISPKMRVAWDGRLFEIDSVQEVKSGRRELHLMCTEIQG